MKTCPDCGKMFGDIFNFCPACGVKLLISRTTAEPEMETGRLKGSLADKKYRTTSIDHFTPLTGDEHSHILGGKLKGNMGKLQFTLEQESKHTPSSSSTSDHLTGKSEPEKQLAKIWIAALSTAAILLIVLIAFSIFNRGGNLNSVPESYTNSADAPKSSTERQENNNYIALSASCDYILCAGNDNKGNKYELVANQTESSHGFEIVVGIIKNNSWLYPLSKDFPFLADDGLFHVSVSLAGKSGTSLKNPNAVIQNIYFLDSGGFLIDCYKANNSPSIYDHSYIMFSCSTKQSYTINCSDSTLLFRYTEPEFRNEYPQSYGKIFTDNGKLILYSQTSGTSSGWTEDQVFEWSVLNTETLTTNVIVRNMKGVRPECTLSEGLFFCSDNCFYRLNGQKSIDLSDYSIDLWDNGDIYFEGGTCSFKAENNLGTAFIVTIDSSGSVLSEVSA